MRVVVTGTDTGVGKTYVSAALRPSVYVKAAQTGDDDDAATVRALCGAEVHTLAWYPEPLAPETRGARGRAWNASRRPRSPSFASQFDDVVVEGAGGLLVRFGAAGRSPTSPRCSTRR